MLILIFILLFFILLAVLPKEDAAGLLRTIFIGFGIFALGTVLFYAWGFYLYETDRAQTQTPAAQAQYKAEHDRYCRENPYEAYQSGHPICIESTLEEKQDENEQMFKKCNAQSTLPSNRCQQQFEQRGLALSKASK